MTEIRSFGFVGNLPLVTLAILIIPQAATSLTNLAEPTFAAYDPDEQFLWISAHHFLQLVLTITLMMALSGGRLSVWGFNLNRLPTSLLFIFGFAGFFGTLEFLRLSNSGTITYPFPESVTNQIGIQVFQYGLSGLGEEPLFRGLVITLLIAGIGTQTKMQKARVPLAISISTALFMLAHIGIDWQTLSITQFDFDQQMKALQLGVLYAVMFLMTRSLLAPIVVHGLSNGLQFTLGFYFL